MYVIYNINRIHQIFSKKFFDLYMRPKKLHCLGWGETTIKLLSQSLSVFNSIKLLLPPSKSIDLFDKSMKMKKNSFCIKFINNIYSLSKIARQLLREFFFNLLFLFIWLEGIFVKINVSLIKVLSNGTTKFYKKVLCLFVLLFSLIFTNISKMESRIGSSLSFSLSFFLVK
jgi:hypothetical protein